MVGQELELEPLATHDGYRLMVSDSEQFGGSVQDFDVWRHDQHLRTFESEKQARAFIDDQLGQAYADVNESFGLDNSEVS